MNVIRGLYERSTISIRITGDGDLATRFRQKRGIRQGSSLFPCLFVLAMDFSLRVFQTACTELGLPSHENTWTAYADGIADKSMSEDEATAALQQLEAASAFVGLRLNVPKTEVLAKGIKKPTPNQPSQRPKHWNKELHKQSLRQESLHQKNSSQLLMTMVHFEDGKWKLKMPDSLELKKS